MHSEFQRIIHQATRLTRRGELQAATETIRRALRHTDARDDDVVVDVEAREVDDGATPALPVGDPRPSQAGADGVDLPAPQVPGPAVGDFVAGRFGGAGLAGRDYKLFIPPGAGTRPMPLVVMLHGCTQDADDFAEGTRLNELGRSEGLFVLYPAQSRRANPQGCWNWFKSNHQGRGRGEPGLLAGMVQDVLGRHPIDPRRVYVAGLSAGGAMAAIVAAAYPELFAAAGVHSGLAPGTAHDVKSAFEAMRKGAAADPRAIPVPTIVFHGDADGTVHVANGRQVVAAAASGRITHAASEERQTAGRRSATRQVLRDAAGAVVAELWVVHGSAHAWSGGSPGGSYTDPQGPDASAEMLRFFLEQGRTR